MSIKPTLSLRIQVIKNSECSVYLNCFNTKSNAVDQLLTLPMSGEELFNYYQSNKQNAGPDSEMWAYAQTLGSALYVVGPDRLYASLEEAERTISYELGPSEPGDIKLINANQPTIGQQKRM